MDPHEFIRTSIVTKRSANQVCPEVAGFLPRITILQATHASYKTAKLSPVSPLKGGHSRKVGGSTQGACKYSGGPYARKKVDLDQGVISCTVGAIRQKKLPTTVQTRPKLCFWGPIEPTERPSWCCMAPHGIKCTAIVTK